MCNNDVKWKNCSALLDLNCVCLFIDHLLFICCSSFFSAIFNLLFLRNVSQLLFSSLTFFLCCATFFVISLSVSLMCFGLSHSPPIFFDAVLHSRRLICDTGMSLFRCLFRRSSLSIFHLPLVKSQPVKSLFTCRISQPKKFDKRNPILNLFPPLCWWKFAYFR